MLERSRVVVLHPLLQRGSQIPGVLCRLDELLGLNAPEPFFWMEVISPVFVDAIADAGIGDELFHEARIDDHVIANFSEGDGDRVVLDAQRAWFAFRHEELLAVDLRFP